MLQKFSAGLMATLLLSPSGILRAGEDKPGDHRKLVDKYHIDHEPEMRDRDLVDLLEKKVKYVFVFYQENRSFDSYFGTFPGAEGLFSHPANETPGFTQQLVDTNGKVLNIQPFRIGPSDQCPKSTVTVGGVTTATTACYAADTDDIDHSHPRIVMKMDIQNNVPQMDQFANIEELKRYTPPIRACKRNRWANWRWLTRIAIPFRCFGDTRTNSCCSTTSFRR
jgi:phospholipase C